MSRASLTTLPQVPVLLPIPGRHSDRDELRGHDVRHLGRGDGSADGRVRWAHRGRDEPQPQPRPQDIRVRGL